MSAVGHVPLYINKWFVLFVCSLYTETMQLLEILKQTCDKEIV